MRSRFKGVIGGETVGVSFLYDSCSIILRQKIVFVMPLRRGGRVIYQRIVRGDT